MVIWPFGTLAITWSPLRTAPLVGSYSRPDTSRSSSGSSWLKSNPNSNRLNIDGVGTAGDTCCASGCVDSDAT